MTNAETLSGLDSIGFGGHVQYHQDFSMFEKDMGYSKSVVREVLEEASIDLSHVNIDDSIIGVINEDSTTTGKNHFGIVHLFELQEKNYRRGEISIRNIGLRRPSEIGKRFGSFEYWSKLCSTTFFSNQLSIRSYVERNSRKSLSSEILVIVGRIGSGKSEACRALATEFGYKIIRTSSVLKKLCGFNENATMSREELQNVGFDLVNSPRGHEKLANGILSEATNLRGTRYVIDGLRYPETLQKITRKIGKQPPVIYLDNNIDRSYKFYMDRESKDLDLKAFLDILAHPVERNVEKFIPQSDFLVYNIGSLKSFHQEIKHFFYKYLG
jgi:hypothetical protein